MEGRESREILGRAMEKYEDHEKGARLRKKWKKTVDGIKKNWVRNLEEFKRFSVQIAGLNESLRLAFQENPAAGSVESFTKLISMANLMGQMVALSPYCNVAADRFIHCLENDFSSIESYVQTADLQTTSKNECLEEIRKLNNLGTVFVTNVDEALFVKKYTSSEVDFPDYLAREKRDEIQVAIDSYTSMFVDEEEELF